MTKPIHLPVETATTILIIDDQTTNRNILGRLAQKIEAGVTVETFATPEAALGWIEETEAAPDLVVTDYNMPRMNGAAFVRAFRALPDCVDVPVIVVTAYEDRALLYDALEAGATDFLQSPVDHKEFATRARNLLNLRLQRNLRLAAERANAAKTEFLANMSHELRTPLNAIIGFAEIMQTQTMGPIGTPKYLEYADDIGSSARHLRDVIQCMLDISRIEQGQLDLEVGQVALGEVLNFAVRVVSGDAKERNVEISLESGTDDIFVTGDRSKLEQVFVNLLSNGVKFTPAGGRIDIGCQAGHEDIIVRVDDTGIGMSKNDLRVAVSRFGQVSSTAYNKRYQGVGLGLPLAIRLVELHGGRLDFDSAPGKGTAVTVRLPINKEDLRKSA